jgi:hypothetical protein
VLQVYLGGQKSGVLLGRYLLPGPGIHKAREVTSVGGSDYDIVVRVLVQDVAAWAARMTSASRDSSEAVGCRYLRASAQKLAASRMTSVVMGR